MKYGRTTLINFLSELAVSVFGFVATIALTRTLGKERYGTYVIVLSVLAWVTIANNLGLLQAIRKRVSESTEENYVISGAIAQFILYVAVAACLWLVRRPLNEYMDANATLAIIVMLAAQTLIGFVRGVLDGQRLVHVSSILSPLESASRSLAQVALVLTGFGLTGAFAGYTAGALVAACIGAYFMSVRVSLPSLNDFRRLQSYAQFSWLSALKGQVFLSMDTIVLAYFAADNSIVAIYGVAWNLATLFSTFGFSISRTLFPEMSLLSSEDVSNGQITDLLRISLAYSGLFIIPGLVGSVLVGDVVLTIYGSGFEEGYYVLLILTCARLLHGYMIQIVNTIDAIDFPNLTFRINLIFVAVNVSLNVLLTPKFGWYGAATATTFSAGLGLLLGYRYANGIVDVVVPMGEIIRQFVSAGVMAVVVLAGRLLVGDSLLAVVGLTTVGAGVYFALLFWLSPEFRTTIKGNL